MEVENSKVEKKEDFVSESEEGLEKEEHPSEPELSGDDESAEGEEDATGEEGEKKKRRR